MKGFFCYTVLYFLLTSCTNPTNSNNTSQTSKDPFEIILEADFDTAKVLQMLPVKEKVSLLHLAKSDRTPELKKQLDTLVLNYYFAFCDCQRWVDSKIYAQAKAEHTSLENMDPRGHIEFNLSKHGFYIEPASYSLKIPDPVYANGTKIIFIGKEYQSLRLPQNGEFTVPNPPKGRVFRYYHYEILRPYNLWGPKVYIGLDDIFGDTMTTRCLLTRY